MTTIHYNSTFTPLSHSYATHTAPRHACSSSLSRAPQPQPTYKHLQPHRSHTVHPHTSNQILISNPYTWQLYITTLHSHLCLLLSMSQHFQQADHSSVCVVPCWVIVGTLPRFNLSGCTLPITSIVLGMYITHFISILTSPPPPMPLTSCTWLLLWRRFHSCGALLGCTAAVVPQYSVSMGTYWYYFDLFCEKWNVTYW